nr:aldehyde dehydrogenase family protein [Sphingomonas sp. Y57]
MRFDADYSMTIDGRAVDTAARLKVIDPATERSITSVPDAGAAELDAAVAAARAAFPGWRGLALDERRALLRAIAGAISDNIESLAKLLTAEQGKPLAEARGELEGASYWCESIASFDLPTIVSEDSDERQRVTYRVPIGVVAGIVPWNYPMLLGVWKIAPALLAGNTVVVKPSPFTPLTMLKLGELLRDILPPGVLNVVTGGDQLGPLITAHPGIDKVSFTGSTATGKRVMASCAANLKRVTLELGGNDPAIVMPDVDVEAVAEQLFWAAFSNSGQICIATKRLYIHEAIYDRLKAAIVAVAERVRVGNGTDADVRLGPVQNRQQYERVRALIADSHANGHDFLIGGDISDGPGFFIPVTIVDNPPENSRVVQEEAFGPVLPLLKFAHVDEAIARANDTIFGLAASVWSADVEQATAIASQLEAGTVWVNEVQNLSPFAVFGGHKQSGLGAENGLEGVLEYTNPQTISIHKAGRQVTPSDGAVPA